MLPEGAGGRPLPAVVGSALAVGSVVGVGSVLALAGTDALGFTSVAAELPADAPLVETPEPVLDGAAPDVAAPDVPAPPVPALGVALFVADATVPVDAVGGLPDPLETAGPAPSGGSPAPHAETSEQTVSNPAGTAFDFLMHEILSSAWIEISFQPREFRQVSLGREADSSGVQLIQRSCTAERLSSVGAVQIADRMTAARLVACRVYCCTAALLHCPAPHRVLASLAPAPTRSRRVQPLSQNRRPSL
jgi:hypothetical protein